MPYKSNAHFQPVEIKVAIISISSNNIVLYKTQNDEPLNVTTHWLLTAERKLRTKAYANTTIKTNDAFFDDSDMTSNYYLIIVYEQLSQTPLLSARYYYDRTIIGKYLKGDLGEPHCSKMNDKTFNILNGLNGAIFLADRLSGNIACGLYRKYRNEIFNVFYSEVKKHNLNKTIILMVREKKQVKKYIALGFHLIGEVIHKEIPHSIVVLKIQE